MRRVVYLISAAGEVRSGPESIVYDAARRDGWEWIEEVHDLEGREEPPEVVAARERANVAALGEQGKREELGELAARVRGTDEEAAVLMAIREQLDKRLTELGVRP